MIFNEFNVVESINGLGTRSTAQWKPRRTPPACSLEVFYSISDGYRSLPQEKFGKIYVKNPLNLVQKAQNVHKSTYFSS